MIKRAPFRYYGGKSRNAAKIAPYIPQTKIYHEPYAGAASLFWRLEPRKVESLNDINEEIINIYRVLQNPAEFDELCHRLEYTPYSFDEFKKARRSEYKPGVPSAWAFFIRQNMGFSGKCTCDGDWGRAFSSSRGMAGTASSFRSRVDMLHKWHERLQRVQLDNRCALESIRYWDSPETTHYVDPPYISDTRTKGKRSCYRYEANDDHHKKLVSLLLEVEGNVILSGYDHDIYRGLVDAGWQKYQFTSNCSSVGRIRTLDLSTIDQKRTETLWIKKERPL